MSEPRCETCRFWLASHGEYGDCHRYPPQIANIYGHTLTAFVSSSDFENSLIHFPVLLADGWCGEYQPRSEPTTTHRKMLPVTRFLGTRAMKALHALCKRDKDSGCFDVTALARTDLQDHWGCGPETVHTIEKYMLEHGFELK